MVTNLNSDSGLSGEQAIALIHVRRHGKRLVDTRTDIAEMYPNKGYQEIAEEVLPYLFSKYPDVAQRAVAYAMRQLVPREEFKERTKTFLGNRLEKMVETKYGKEGFKSEGFSKQCQMAATRRHELHGVDTDAMILARGRVPWKTEEKMYGAEIAVQDAYVRQSGRWEGCTNYELVAEDLNRVWHDGKPVRSEISAKGTIRPYLLSLRREGL